VVIITTETKAPAALIGAEAGHLIKGEK